MSFNLSYRKVEVFIRNSSVENYKNFWNRSIKLIKEEQSSVLECFIELSFMVLTIGINKAGYFVFLSNCISKVELESQCFSYLFADYILTSTSFTAQVNGKIVGHQFQDCFKSFMEYSCYFTNIPLVAYFYYLREWSIGVKYVFFHTRYYLRIHLVHTNFYHSFGDNTIYNSAHLLHSTSLRHLLYS